MYFSTVSTSSHNILIDHSQKPSPTKHKSHVSFPIISFDRLPVLEGVTTGAHVAAAVVAVVTAHLGVVQDTVVG